MITVSNACLLDGQMWHTIVSTTHTSYAATNYRSTLPPSKRKFLKPPSADDVNAIVLAAEECPFSLDVQDVVTILFHTGIRRGELSGLRWADVHFDERYMTIAPHWTSPTRRVPFAEKVLSILRARLEREPESEYVLGNDPHRVLQRVSRQVIVLSARAGKNVLNLHSLRHSFAARWRNLGYCVYPLALICGWSNRGSLMKNFLTDDQWYWIAAKYQALLEGRE